MLKISGFNLAAFSIYSIKCNKVEMQCKQTFYVLLETLLTDLFTCCNFVNEMFSFDVILHLESYESN